MGGFGWTEVVALLTSIGFGTVSAVVPLANAEVYVAASQVSAVVGPVPIAVGVGIGQTVGKLLLFMGVRRGREFRLFRERRKATATGRSTPEVVKGPRRQQLERVVNRLLALVGTKRWGLPIVLLAAVTGLPPLYAVALLAGATKMRATLFALTVLVGRVTRFVLVALGAGSLPSWPL